MHQILSNLHSNALKFTPEGGRVLLKAEAEPSMARRGCAVHFLSFRRRCRFGWSPHLV